MDNTARRLLEVLMDEEIVSDILHEMSSIAARAASGLRVIGTQECKDAASGWQLAAEVIEQAAKDLESGL